jgi:hypothetical protein
MGMLKFKINDDFKAIVKHTMEAPAQRVHYGDPTKEPCLCLVHDDGIYMMSNGEPAQDNPNRDKTKNGALLLVVHAEGCNPDTDGDDVWNHCRTLVGGDDFGERIPAKDFVTAIEKGATACHINWGARKYTIAFKYPGVVAKAKLTPVAEPGKELAGFSKEIAALFRKEVDTLLAALTTKYGVCVHLGNGLYDADTLKFPLEFIAGGKTPAVRDFIKAVESGRLPGYTLADLNAHVKTKSRDFILTGYDARRRSKPMTIKDPVTGGLFIMSVEDCLKGLQAAKAAK